MIPVVAWSLLLPSGEIEKGRGTRPPPGWFNRVRESLGLALLVAGYPPVYAVRPACSNDVDRFLCADGAGGESRFWGVIPSPGDQVWLYPDARMIGVGRDTSEVERLVLAFQGKLSPGEVCSGPDQRDRAGTVSSR